MAVRSNIGAKLLVVGLLIASLTSVVADTRRSHNVFDALRKNGDKSDEFNVILKTYSLRIIEETTKRLIFYKKDKDGKARIKLTRIYGSEDGTFVVEFSSPFVSEDADSVEKSRESLESKLLCKRIVWSRRDQDQRIPYGLQIGKDDVRQVVEKVNDRILDQEFDDDESGFINYYFPNAGGPSLKLHFEFGVLTKLEQFYG